jgi:hypothetical protein
MFKKKKIKAKERLRKTRVDDEEDEASAAPTSGETNGAQEETSAMEAILQVKKKRKLLQSVQFKRGLDAAATIQAPVIAAGDDEPHQAGQNKDLEERLKGSFSGGTGGDFSSGNGVMERKHKAAMEEFIRQHLDSKDAAAAAEANIDGAREPSTVKELEKKLYQELASSAQTLAGTTLKGPMTVEGDVGSGGSMLGGTGIAEVSLPVDVRLKTVAETSAATLNARRLFSKDQAASKSAIAELPMSFAPGKGKRGKREAVPMMKVAKPANGPTEPVHTTESEQIAKTASSAGHGVLSSDVSGVASSYSHNFRLHAQEWLQEKKDSERAPNEQIDEQSSAGGVDEDRIGFAAARGRGGDQSLDKAKGDSERQKRSSDDRVYKSFMTRQKEQRDRR